jgi:hypothetical protein
MGQWNFEATFSKRLGQRQAPRFAAGLLSPDSSLLADEFQAQKSPA